MYGPSTPMKGITLIELGVALSILAILAAMLLPRIAELQRAARVGELRYLHGIVSARMTLVHLAVQLREGRPDRQPCQGGATADNRASGAGTVCTEAGLVATWHGYPAAEPADNLKLTEAEMPPRRYEVQAASGRTTYQRRDAHMPSACAFTYSQALDARTAAAVSPPVVTGC